jgi:hypothetical protein
MLQLLEKIVAQCEGDRCGETQNYLASVFQREIAVFQTELDQLNIPLARSDWTITQMYYWYSNQHKWLTIIDDMKAQLDKGQSLFMSIDIDAIDVEHSFTLFKIDSQLYVVDSYIHIRNAEIRPFVWADLINLLTGITGNKWNTLFKCEDYADFSKGKDMLVTYTYEDKILKQHHLYEDDIMRF